MLLLDVGVLFGGEYRLWKAFLRTIFLDFGQKSGRSAGGMSFDEAGCLNCLAKPISVCPYFAPTKLEREKRCAEADKKMGQKMHCAAMTFGARCEAKCSALPCCPLSSSNPNAVHSRFCSFLFSNKTSLSSLLFSPLRLASGRQIPQALVPFCPVLSSAHALYAHVCYN